MEIKDDKKEVPPVSDFRLLPVAFELGYTIAIPLVACAFLGRFLDKKFDSSPLFLLIGFLLAITVTAVAIYRKVAHLFK